jgi:molybdate transport system substrate-binding protein
MPKSILGFSVVLVGLLAGCGSPGPSNGKHEITIAAAANLTDVFGPIGSRFEAETGIHPVFSFAATSLLTQQIEHSAPFDLFAAADSSHVDGLARKGLLAPGSRAVYVRGILALWIPPGSRANIARLEDLPSPQVHTIAVAKPELAPYGEAAVETLKSLGIWDQVKAKVVYAENISIARQYGLSKNADAVLTAYSLVLREGGKVLQVDERLHRPITQELGILARAAHPEAARRFAAFLLSGDGRTILGRYGYALPPRP